MSTVRELLSQAAPHVSLKKAWKATIQALRRARTEGADTALHKRSAVDSFLDMNAPQGAEMTQLKEHLRDVLNTPDPGLQVKSALMVDSLAQTLRPERHNGPVDVEITGLPAWLSSQDVTLLTGLETIQGPLSPRDAAALVHHFDGMMLGGDVIRVRAQLDRGTTLPPIRRQDRFRQRARGVRPWLPFFDDVGQYSATPKRLASRNGKMLADTGLKIFDPFCGLGGDTIAAALEGAEVLASDLDQQRLLLAKQNAEHFGVSDKIIFSHRDAQIVFADPLLPESCLFLDPPWGGPSWDRENMDLTTWLGDSTQAVNAIQNARAVLLKLPRTFDLSSLHETGRDWNFGIGVETIDDHPAERVRILTAFSAKT